MKRKIIPWTIEEDTLLKEMYLGTSREIILEKIHRTWSAIRLRAMTLKVKRSAEIVKEENVKYTKKAMLEKYGVEYSTLLPSMQRKCKKTNLEKRGVEYPTQSKSVRDKVKKTVQEKYGVDNVFQSQEIKKRITKTNLEVYGVENPNQNQKVREKSEKTNLDRYGVKNPFQIKTKIRDGMIYKYGEAIPLLVPQIILKKKKTCLQKYGYEHAIQNPEVRENLKKSLNKAETKEKIQKSLREKGKISSSAEEQDFLNYLIVIDPDIEWHPIHPIIKHTIDFYSPKFNLWIQYDGTYWHGKNNVKDSRYQQESIEKVKKKDEFENEMIPNLVRFWSDEFIKAKKENTAIEFIMDKIKNKTDTKNNIVSCHQYLKKIENYTEDIKNLPFNTDNLSAKDFILDTEPMSTEIREFIEKYEWLGTIGSTPKWCFTARYRGILGGVVLINEPTAYSKILGKDTPTLEALIQRGATASWTPKNIGSRLIMYACRWMVNNTPKRAFVGYADPAANERGIIYQACSFDYLGDNFGEKYVYQDSTTNRIISIHSMRRTSAFIKWCRQNDIEINKEWFKSNKFKDLKKIPEDIKSKWNSDIKKAIENSKKIAVLKKGKYVIVLSKGKKEKEILDSLKTYVPLPYKKGYNVSTAIGIDKVNVNNHGKTASRKNSTKLQFIIDNHEKMSRPELARELNETARWVKRQIALLIKQGKISPKKGLQIE